jgi:hypothetical protein
MMNSAELGRDPDFWATLSNDDKEIYTRIRSALSAPSSRNKRNTRIDDFREIIDAIDLFENTDEQDREKRCLVCGICKLTDGIAVNTNQLQKLISKCKSSINGCLKGLGYDHVSLKPSMTDELLRQIPYLRTTPSEQRQWTIRARSTPEPVQMSADITPPSAGSPTSDGFGFELTLGGSPCETREKYTWEARDVDSFSMDDAFGSCLFHFD